MYTHTCMSLFVFLSLSIHIYIYIYVIDHGVSSIARFTNKQHAVAVPAVAVCPEPIDRMCESYSEVHK